MPLAYDIHPEFGYFCPGPRGRRALRVALVSILFGMVIGAQFFTAPSGQTAETNGVSSNSHVKSFGPGMLVPGVAGASPEHAGNARADGVEAIKPFPMRMVRMRSSKPASPLAGIPLGRTRPPEPDIVPDSTVQASSENARDAEWSAVSLQARSSAAIAEPAVSGINRR